MTLTSNLDCVLVDVAFEITSCYPSVVDGQLTFEECSHDHFESFYVPKEIAGDTHMVNSYIRNILEDSMVDVATSHVYSVT